MDPVSVAGIAAACSSVVKLCVSTSKTLHDLAEVYKDAELSILSMIQECETVQFAWSRLEIWVKESLDTPDCELLEDRLCRSVYAGRLILAAFKEELVKAAPRHAIFRRRLGLVWNSAVFEQHQSRLRGHCAALQLLLQVISMPRREDRMELICSKGHVFREAEESILNIAPSRVSSRLSARLSLVSFLASDASSVNTRRSSTLHYIPLDFENDLFTSFVYKRNYGLPFVSRRTKRAVTRDAQNGRKGFLDVLLRSDSGMGGISIAAPFETRRKVARDQSVALQRLHIPLREGTAIAQGDGLDSPRNVHTFSLIESRHYAGAMSCLHTGVDVIWLFDSNAPVEAATLLEFFSYIRQHDNVFFSTVLERIAFSAGEHWIRRFRKIIDPLITGRSEAQWSEAENAGRRFDWAHLPSEGCFPPSALQLACGAGNRLVTTYLLRIGFRPSLDEEYMHPFLLAHLNEDTAMLKIIRESLEIPKDFFTQALLALFDSSAESLYWCKSKNGEWKPIEKAMNVLLQLGAQPQASVDFMGKTMPFIHAVIYTIHTNKGHHKLLLNMLGHLVHTRADANTIAEVCWGRTETSPLALAVALDEHGNFKTLLRNKARVIWWGRRDPFHVFSDCEVVEERVNNELVSWWSSSSECEENDAALIQTLRLGCFHRGSFQPYGRIEFAATQDTVCMSFQQHREQFHKRYSSDLYSCDGSDWCQKGGCLHVRARQQFLETKTYTRTQGI